MKHIQKNSEPEVFTDWKTKKKNPTYERFKKTRNVRMPVKEALMREQGDLCCYCERRITLDDSHIEHFKPRKNSTVDPLDFQNMLCSCQKDLLPGEPRHCGNAKGDCDPTLLVSPLDSSCETRFSFNGDGNIKPAKSNDPQAVETIEQLQLDSLKLVNFRQGAIAPFLDPDLSDEDFQDLVRVHLARNSAGQFGDFWTTIRYLFGGAIA